MVSKMLFPAELPTWALFAELVMAGAVVVMAGSLFTRYAAVLAERLNLGSGWIGLILLATVTSLPELVTAGTATTIGNVDLALGAILGSCCFNITLIVLLNALLGGGSVLRKVSAAHVLTSSFGLLLIGEALLGMVLLDKFSSRSRISQVGELCWAALIAVTYLGCVRLVYRFERTLGEDKVAKRVRHSVGAGLWSKLAATATVLVAASWWLALLGDTLSTHEIKMIGRPLGATFVGACFLALATSLPEIVTSIASVRMGNVDLALGNIFGSNMFNIFVIPFLKVVSVCHGDARLLATEAFTGTQNLIAGLLAIVLTAIALGGLAYKSQGKLLRRFGFDSILIAIAYCGGMLLLLMDGSR
ncbi:MAG: sodium:calcium antiporter [Phycisphaerae bacterium]